MKERPILFSGPMVRAILDGRKTQTRRIVKQQPPADFRRHCWMSAPVYGWTNEPVPAGTWHTARCPYGFDGDRLWVRETWRTVGDAPLSICTEPGDIGYAATADEATLTTMRWRPSIHMPRWVSRIALEVTGVRVERLQEITSKDAQAEGVPFTVAEHTFRKCFRDPEERASERLKRFAELWEAINGDRAPWESNPWVWVVSFKQVSNAAP